MATMYVLYAEDNHNYGIVLGNNRVQLPYFHESAAPEKDELLKEMRAYAEHHPHVFCTSEADYEKKLNEAAKAQAEAERQEATDSVKKASTEVKDLLGKK